MKELNVVSIALELLVAQDKGEPIAFRTDAADALGLALEVMDDLGHLESNARELLQLAYVLEVEKRSPSAAATIFEALSSHSGAARWLETTLKTTDPERLVSAARRFSSFSGEERAVAPSLAVGRPLDDFMLRALAGRRKA